jgi:hypothetical protein
MYSKLKADMRNAGISVSEGDEINNTDMQLIRDFLFFKGVNIGEDFHRYEEAVYGNVDKVSADTTEIDNEPEDSADDTEIDQAEEAAEAESEEAESEEAESEEAEGPSVDASADEAEEEDKA